MNRDLESNNSGLFRQRNASIETTDNKETSIMSIYKSNCSNLQPASTFLKETISREKMIKRDYADMFADHTIQATTLRKERLIRSMH